MKRSRTRKKLLRKKKPVLSNIISNKTTEEQLYNQLHQSSLNAHHSNRQPERLLMFQIGINSLWQKKH